MIHSWIWFVFFFQGVKELKELKVIGLFRDGNTFKLDQHRVKCSLIAKTKNFYFLLKRALYSGPWRSLVRHSNWAIDFYVEEWNRVNHWHEHQWFRFWNSSWNNRTDWSRRRQLVHWPKAASHWFIKKSIVSYFYSVKLQCLTCVKYSYLINSTLTYWLNSTLTYWILVLF